MGINITHTMNANQQFENRENLRNAAKNILTKQGSSESVVNNILDNTVFDYNPQLSIIKASTQISINNSLKETLKYLKSHSIKKPAKEPVFGELWELTAHNDNKFENNELYEFEIDSSARNIFAA